MHKDTGTGWPQERPGGTPSEPSGGTPSEPSGGTPLEPSGGTPLEPVVAPAPYDDAVSAGPDPGTRKRFTAAGAMIGLLLGLLGFALVVQVKSNATDPELASARPDDMVRILSDLQAREDRLRREISELEESQRQLASGAQGRQAVLDEARRRADELGILAGTLPAEGPGLAVVFEPRDKPIKASAILDAVQELRGAGAEAMQISGAGGTAVRIVASTAFVDGEGGVISGGQRLVAPYTIIAVGDPQTMETALNIPGGVVESVRKDGGNVTVQRPDQVQVTALHQQGDLKHAQPAT